MRAFFVAFSILIGLSVIPTVRAAEREPVAHVIELDLQGEDATKGTAIVRDGVEHKPAIWMPLYDGDIVFVRDPKSHILIDYGDGGRVLIDQSRMRAAVSEKTAHGGGAWSLISSLGEVLMGEEGEEVPTNLISKGADNGLSVPAASHGPNFIVRDGRPVWIAWNGGTAPFTISFEQGKGSDVLATTSERMAEIRLPDSKDKRSALIISDANKQQVRVPLRFKAATPSLPSDLALEAATPELKLALTAGWLADQEGGAWRIEAVRILRAVNAQDGRLDRLGAALLAGWQPK